MRRILFALALSIVAFAPPARADAASDLAAKVVVVLERAATVAVMNRSDCDAMGDKLTKMLDDNETLFQRAREANEKLTDAQRDALRARYGARTQAAMQKLIGPVMACRTNAKVAALLSRVRVF